MARMQWIGLSFLGLALGSVGCVPAEKYNAMKLSEAAAIERLAQADAQSKAATAEADAYKRQLESLMAGGNSRDAMVANLTTQLTDLQGRYADLESRYQQAVNNTGIIRVLPEQLSNALTDFANANPDLVDFDSSKGIVKFKSDVTFNTGSAELRPEARNAIARFAQILNSQQAAGYELQVAGHTDSTRVSNPATIKAGHLDNWYLSSHRAISVGKALQAQNVAPTRIAVVGYADHHPIANNATDQGRAQNRRVEVLILPSQAKSGAGTSTAEAGGTPRPNGGAPVRPVLNKDTTGAGVDNRPVINK